MPTIIQGKGNPIELTPAGPACIIGERINPSGKPALRQALLNCDWDFVKQEAVKQVAAGADIIDVNVGGKGIDEVAVLPRAVAAVAEVVDAPICIDTRIPEALQAALAMCPGRPLVNSISAEKKALADILPIVAAHQVPVIALCMGQDGIPPSPESRIANARQAFEAAVKAGVREKDILFDPLVMPVSADDQAGRVTLETIRGIRELFPENNITGGASNISFGMPVRSILNRNFLVAAFLAGMNVPITDATEKDLRYALLSANIFKGLDKRTKNFMKYYRLQ
jgi:5-methyltetrahydrofolate--homocysteine methyltransferase